MAKENPWASILSTGSESSRLETEREAERAKLEAHWAEHPWNWLSGEDTEEREVTPGIWSRALIWTNDEGDEKAPIKPFPADLEYLRYYIEALHTEKEIIVDKARQMIVTTATLLYIDWNCRFRDGRKWIWSKSIEEEAQEHLEKKIRRVHTRLPLWIQLKYPLTPKPAGKIDYPKTGSVIMAAAENAALRSARGGTATGYGIDEGAFQDTFADIWDAAAPMAGKLIAITTAKMGGQGAKDYLMMLGDDRTPSPMPPHTTEKNLLGLPNIEGLNFRRSAKQYLVVEIDMEADPSKRSVEYQDEARRRSTDERKYRREFRRDWTVSAGESFYPEFSDHGGPDMYVYQIPRLFPTPVIRGWDFGFRAPACIFMQKDPDAERVYVLRELFAPRCDIYTFRDLVLCLSGEIELEDLPSETADSVFRWWRRIESDPRMPDPPWFESKGSELRFVDFCGPEAMKVQSLPSADAKERSDAEVLEAGGIYLSMQSVSIASRETVIRKLLRPQEDGWPGLILDPACPLLIEAFGGALAYPKASSANPLPDQPAKNGRHDNVHDALGYPLVQIIEVGDGANAKLWKAKQAGLRAIKMPSAPMPLRSLGLMESR